ncbi:disease resistance protein [Spatholobus suberectus]|nr:disease resistance protein [Spatholobus suberectus]
MANMVEKMGCWCWSKSPDVRRIQEELGNKLDPKLLDKITNLNERASRLRDRIKMEANILIILDDVRGEINLAKIGIPFENDHNSCKILLVAESEEVLSNQMNSPQRTISVLGL